jgi:hypothetical protein
MPEFTIIDERRKPLEVNQYSNVDLLPYFRFEHRVTVGYRGRRLMAFIDNLGKGAGPIVYIEEVTDGRLTRIEDDGMFEATYRFIEPKGFLGMFAPMMKPRG